jgi:hypothetical protein
MPLALELAAGSLVTTEMAAVVGEIEHNMDFLVSDLRDMPPRHRSLRAVFESTWRRLRPQTRQVFAALSTFRGSFSRVAAREVAAASPEQLSQLVAHALLQSYSEESRYHMHEMMRQFASEKLAGTPELEQAVTQRHFAFFNDLAQRGGAAMHGGDQLGWTARLQQEYDNIRKAIDWAAENDMQAAAGIVIALNTFWHNSGRFQEGLRQCERILPYQNRLSPDLRPWLLGVYADMTWELGRSQESAAVRTELPQLFKQHGDEAGIAYSYLKLTAVTAVIHGDIDRSIKLARDGLQHALTPRTDFILCLLVVGIIGW